MWQSFKHWSVSFEHTYPGAHGHASPSWPSPGGMQLVVPSAFTIVHISPSGHGICSSRSLQLIVGKQTGIMIAGSLPAVSAISCDSQYVFAGHASASPQQYARHTPPPFGVAVHPCPGLQSVALLHANPTP